MDRLAPGMVFGLGTCINDGDLAEGEGGQGGWSGWAPYGIVHGGKQARSLGLATLTGEYTVAATLQRWGPQATAAVACIETNEGGATGGGCSANALDQDGLPEARDMRWNIPSVESITADGDLSDWDGIAFMSQTPFRPCNQIDATSTYPGRPCAAPFVEFDICTACVGEATWHGVSDHSMAAAMAWTPSTPYMGINVLDDTHQNAGSGWNGDTVQVMFTNAERIGRAQTGTAAGMILYNYGLAKADHLVLHHGSHPCPLDDFCTGDGGDPRRRSRG